MLTFPWPTVWPLSAIVSQKASQTLDTRSSLLPPAPTANLISKKNQKLVLKSTASNLSNSALCQIKSTKIRNISSNFSNLSISMVGVLPQFLTEKLKNISTNFNLISSTVTHRFLSAAKAYFTRRKTTSLLFTLITFSPVILQTIFTPRPAQEEPFIVSPNISCPASFVNQI